MRYLSVLLILAMLLVSFGLSHGVTLEATVSGNAVWNDGSEILLTPCCPFDVNITAHFIPADTAILGWSTPFWFYGTGNVTTLVGGPGTLTTGPVFTAAWNMGHFTQGESWDGDLTNSDSGGITGDQMNQSGIHSGIFHPNLPGCGSAVILTFSFDGIVGDSSTYGQFCIDSGNFINATFDWLMQPPVPFAPVCWDVVPAILECGDVNTDCAVNIYDITYLINYLYLEGPPPVSMESADVDGIDGINIFDVSHLIAYLYLSGPPLDCP